MRKRLFSLLLLLMMAFVVKAANIDTLLIKSASMNKEVKVLTVVPQDKGTYPVIYLLHGYGGDAHSWIGIRPDLPRIADEKGIIFVCPDGKNSWYWDSPVDSTYRYETFVSKELVRYIDAHCPTIAHRSKRAITGLSMGGHGAIWLSFRHKEIFGAAGSTSGGLDIRFFPNNWEMSKRLGAASENKEVWDAHTAINQISNLKNGDLAILIDCGYSDFFYDVNNDFHQALRKYGIDHDFIVRPGGHNRGYWANSIDYQILFFHKFFNRK